MERRQRRPTGPRPAPATPLPEEDAPTSFYRRPRPDLAAAPPPTLPTTLLPTSAASGHAGDEGTILAPHLDRWRSSAAPGLTGAAARSMRPEDRRRAPPRAAMVALAIIGGSVLGALVAIVGLRACAVDEAASPGVPASAAGLAERLRRAGDGGGR